MKEDKSLVERQLEWLADENKALRQGAAGQSSMLVLVISVLAISALVYVLVAPTGGG